MQVLKIEQLNSLIKSIVESDTRLKNFCVEAEASNIKYYDKHLYLTLKDGDYNIKCASFNYKFHDIPTDIKEGNKIRVYGSANVYKNNANVQILTSRIEKIDGIGDLYVKREELIKIYKAKGYFDEAIKKKLPRYPKVVGVVTAHTGAAIHDIINTTHKRNPNVDIYVYSAKVQGEGSSKEVARGIEYFNNSDLNVDCLIVGRGGGSIEDLWSFNEVEIIEAIYASKIPVISAVGHEVDVLISDFVADKRASTPTQAAEILIPIKADIQNSLNDLRLNLNNELKRKVTKYNNKLDLLKNNYHYQKFYSLQILDRISRIEEIKKELRKQIIYKLSTKEKRLKLANFKNKVEITISTKLNNKKMYISNLAAKLEKFDTTDILNRGYSITLKNGKIIKNQRLKSGDILETIYGNKKKITSEVK